MVSRGANVAAIMAAAILLTALDANASSLGFAGAPRSRRLHQSSASSATIPTGFKKIKCSPAPNPQLGFNTGKEVGKVCGIWYDEIACKEVDAGSTFGTNAADICCAKGTLPLESRALEVANWDDCIASVTGARAACEETGSWPQKVCCVAGVCA